MISLIALFFATTATAQGLPDLVIDDISTGCDGTDTIATLHVSNLGAGHASGFYVDLFVGHQQGPLIGDIGDLYVHLPSLDAGESTTVEFAIPEDQPWDYPYLDAIVDTDEIVTESNENNNVDWIGSERPVCESFCELMSSTYRANPRPATELVCDLDLGEELVGVFYENHPGYPLDWVDGFGLACSGPAGVRMVYNAADIDLTKGELNDLICAGDTIGIGIATLDAAGQTRLDGAVLYCDDGTVAQDGDNLGVLEELNCPAGETLVGISYKDGYTENGTWTDSTESLAAVCTGGSTLGTPEAVEEDRMDGIDRVPFDLLCDPGESVLGVVYDGHDSPAIDWVDGAGLWCSNGEVWNDDDVDNDTADDTVLACGGEIVGIGIGYVELYGLERVDGLVLYCEDGSTVAPNEVLSVTTDVMCPVGEAFVGLSYKDAETPDGTWSDSMDGIVPMCAPMICEL